MSEEDEILSAIESLKAYDKRRHLKTCLFYCKKRNDYFELPLKFFLHNSRVLELVRNKQISSNDLHFMEPNQNCDTINVSVFPPKINLANDIKLITDLHQGKNQTSFEIAPSIQTHTSTSETGTSMTPVSLKEASTSTQISTKETSTSTNFVPPSIENLLEDALSSSDESSPSSAPIKQKRIKTVIKGLRPETTPETLITDPDLLKFPIQNIFQMHERNTFIAMLLPSEKTQDFLNLKTIQDQEVQIELYDAKKRRSSRRKLIGRRPSSLHGSNSQPENLHVTTQTNNITTTTANQDTKISLMKTLLNDFHLILQILKDLD